MPSTSLLRARMSGSASHTSKSYVPRHRLVEVVASSAPLASRLRRPAATGAAVFAVAGLLTSTGGAAHAVAAGSVTIPESPVTLVSYTTPATNTARAASTAHAAKAKAAKAVKHTTHGSLEAHLPGFDSIHVAHSASFVSAADHENASYWATGLRRLRDCESGGNYADATGNGYYGAYQFNVSTWRSLGLSGLPSQASPALQDAAVTRLHSEKGWGPWPVCSYVAGLR